MFSISKIIPFSYHSPPFSWSKTDYLILVLIAFIFIDINCLAKCKIQKIYRKHSKMQEICITWLFFMFFKQNSHHKLSSSFFFGDVRFRVSLCIIFHAASLKECKKVDKKRCSLCDEELVCFHPLKWISEITHRAVQNIVAQWKQMLCIAYSKTQYFLSIRLHKEPVQQNICIRTLNVPSVVSWVVGVECFVFMFTVAMVAVAATVIAFAAVVAAFSTEYISMKYLGSVSVVLQPLFVIHVNRKC